MISWILGLLLLGLILTAIEVLLPGSVFGLIGGGCCIAGIVLAYKHSGGWVAFATLMGTLAALSAVLGLSIRYFPKFKWAHPFFERAARHGRSVMVLDGEPIIGRQGIVLTDLKPSGHIDLNGIEYAAYSADGHLPVGTAVTVTGHKISKLIVHRVKDAETDQR